MFGVFEQSRGGVEAFPSAPHIVSPEGAVAAYFTEPAGLVLQFVEAVPVTEQRAHWILEQAVHGLLHRFPDNDELVCVFDLRLMTARDPAARSLLLRTAPGLRHRFGALYVVPPPRTSAFSGGALRGLTMVLRAMGVQIRVEDSLDVVLRRTGQRPVR